MQPRCLDRDYPKTRELVSAALKESSHEQAGQEPAQQENSREESKAMKPLTAEQASNIVADECNEGMTEDEREALYAIATGKHKTYDAETGCVVPLEPTEAMFNAYEDYRLNTPTYQWLWSDEYRAIIAAAQQTDKVPHEQP